MIAGSVGHGRGLLQGGTRELLGLIEMFRILNKVLMYIFIETHQTGHLRRVNLNVPQLDLNKPDLKVTSMDF